MKKAFARRTDSIDFPGLCHQHLGIHSSTYFIHHKIDTIYITLHLLPPVGSPGFCDLSISAIICSNALPTFSSNRALASVKLQLNSSANLMPSSAWTWRWSAFRSLLFPTMTNGTQSAPYQQVRQMGRGSVDFGLECLPGDSEFCPLVFGSSQRIASKRRSRPACSHECR